MLGVMTWVLFASPHVDWLTLDELNKDSESFVV